MENIEHESPLHQGKRKREYCGLDDTPSKKKGMPTIRWLPRGHKVSS